MNAKHLIFALLGVFVFSTGNVVAQLYKSVDEDGNIVYSDTPTPGAEQLTPPPLSTVKPRPKPVDPPGAEAKVENADSDEAAEKPPTKYTKFNIIQPKHDDTIWDNSGAVPVAIELEPALDTDNGHSIWVYVDGKAVVRKSQSLVQPLSNIDRGTHKIRAEIRDEKRKTLKRTKNVTVHLKRASSIPRSGP